MVMGREINEGVRWSRWESVEGKRKRKKKKEGKIKKK